MLEHGTTTHALTGSIVGATPAELAAAAFLAGYSNQKTRMSYGMHLRDWFGFCETHDIDPLIAQRVHIELWVRTLEERGNKPRTRALKITAIRSFYRYCLDENMIQATPADRVKRPTIERRSPRGALSRTQLSELIDGARELGDHQEALVMLLGFNGLRIGETCAANVEDVIFDGFSPVLILPSRKGGKEGSAPLSRPLEAVLTRCIDGRESGPLLINNAGNRMTRHNAQTVLDRAMRNVRGRHPRVSPHVLRHTWCTIAVAAGASLERIQHDGGWADTRMAEYYCHTKHDPLNATTHLVAGYVFSVN